MLTILLYAIEEWDERNEEFIYADETVLNLEHSLVSISKWESKWKKPFLGKQDKTYEETISYIQCMSLHDEISEEVVKRLDKKNIDEINNYIGAEMTATYFYEPDKQGSLNREPITSELIYYWMVAYNIPSEYQYWHLSRLMTLIKICGIKNDTSKKKTPTRQIMSRNAALNASRRKQMNSKG